MTEAEKLALRCIRRWKRKIVRPCKVCYGAMWFPGPWGCHGSCIDTPLYHQRVEEMMTADPWVEKWKETMDKVEANFKAAQERATDGG